MTESENSQPQNDSDEDIYRDIPEFNFEDELAKLEGSKETYKQEANNLSEKVKALTEENLELKKSNEVLKKNLSTLLKTAQAEVQRKDSMIEELRTKVESFTFRRNKIINKDKYTSTEDICFNTEPQFETDKLKITSKRKKTKTHENRPSNEGEKKSIQEEEKKKESSSRREENSDCDNDRKSNCRENSKTNFRHSASNQDTYDHDKHRDRRFSRYENSSGYRRPYRENHRDHLKYDSFDKKRHSRSSDNRFLPRRRNSRERRDDRRRDDSSERKSRRSGESSERSRKRDSKKGRSRSREFSRGSKESSLEKRKSRSSLEKDSSVRIKEHINTKVEIPESIRSNTDIIENKKPTNLEEETAIGMRNKQVKEKKSAKPEKRSGLDVFSAKSPLDALYNDMVSSRNSNRFSSSQPATPLPDSDLEDGELSATLTPKEQQNISESHMEEDWTLSFKNERPNETKPMTLYSRRMMRKFSSELKNTDNKEEKFSKIEKEKEPENKTVEKIEEVEKEPGELTDDENIVESSKEFQELTKVASIESEIIEEAAKENTFKEPLKREFSKLQILEDEPVLKEIQKEVEKPTTEESSGCKEVEPNIDIHEVIEFSPFKNNYKLIEISPVKPSSSEHVLDFYNQRPPSKQLTELNAVILTEDKLLLEKSSLKLSETSEEKDSWKNSSSEKDFDSELKIIIPPISKSPKEDDEKSGKKCEKEPKNRKKAAENKSLNAFNKETNSGRPKRRSASNQETEKLTFDNKSQKRKRKASESEIGKVDIKKRKIKENEPLRKSTRTKRNSKSEPDPKSEYVPETENKSKEDISSFEFFKPTAKTDNSVDVGKTVSTTADYKMTATMSVTGVVRLETPNKCVEKLKNLMINEHMIFNVLDSKKNSQFSPLIGSKCVEMTPRRMLKNDLMLTDSEDDSVSKRNEEKCESEELIPEEEMEMEEEDENSEESESSECDSDSGASDFVDLL